MKIYYKILIWSYNKIQKKDKEDFKRYIRWEENNEILYDTLNKFMLKNPPDDYDTYEKYNFLFSNNSRGKLQIGKLIGKLIGRLVFCRFIDHWWGHWFMGERQCAVCGKIQTIDEFITEYWKMK